MRMTTPLGMALALALATPAATAQAQEPFDPDRPETHRAAAPAAGDPDVRQPDPEAAPDGDYVWEDGHEAKDGAGGKGFYRLRARAGMRWERGRFENGNWTSGHWVPSGRKAGHLWVRGHRGPDGYWVPGHWRAAARPGHVWIAAALAGGAWRHGFWRPVKVREDHVWVPGHHGPHGRWIPGLWRPRVRAGHRWQTGHWRHGHWVPGSWRPTQAKAGHLWVGGHRAPDGRWVNGHWRVKARAGHHWRAGHWGPSGWVVGAWAAGQRRRVVRRHPHKPVHQMRIERRTHRRVHRPGVGPVHRPAVRPVHRPAVKQIRHGRAVQHRGKRMEAVGAATGNGRLEAKGKRKKERGKRIKLRGKRRR